jgi:hypothetical protein
MTTILEAVKNMLNITDNSQDDYLLALKEKVLKDLESDYINPLLTTYVYEFDNLLKNTNIVFFKRFNVNFQVLSVTVTDSNGVISTPEYTYTNGVLYFKTKPMGRVRIVFQRGYLNETDIDIHLMLLISKLVYLEYYETKYGGLVSSEQSVDGVRNTYKDFEEQRASIIYQIKSKLGYYGV